MRRAVCVVCKTTLPIAKMYVIGGSRLCEPCATRRAQDIRAGGNEPRVERALDPTLCSQCGADKGDSEWLKVAGAPLCFRCRQRFYEVPYPAWMRASLVVLALLAAYALWHGERYLEAGMARARGERLLAAGHYAASAAELRRVLEAGSESQDVLLMAAKAYLLAGDYEHARLLMNGHAHFETGELYYEVLKLWERAVKANDLAGEARQLAAKHDYASAAAKAREAAALYPEMSVLASDAETLAQQVVLSDSQPALAPERAQPARAAGKAAR